MPYSYNAFTGTFVEYQPAPKVAGVYLPLSGGDLTGSLSVSGTTALSGVLTVVGDISAGGTIYGNIKIPVGMDLAVRSLTSYWDSTYTTVSSNSANWNYQGSDIKALTGNWESTYGTVYSLSSSWINLNNVTNYLSTNNVLLSSLTTSGSISSNGMIYGNLYGLAGFYLPLSGGEITGNLSVSGTTTLSGNTIIGNVNNPIATLYADDSKVGVNTETPNEALTVVGNISASGTIYGNLNGPVLDVGVRSLTSYWDSTYTTVNANSSTAWNYQGTDLKNLSGNWQNTFTTVQSNSANWNYQGSDLKALTGNWDSTYTTVYSNSASWATDSTTDSAVRALTSFWDSTYTTVYSNSSTNWSYQGTDLKNLSANWQNTFTTVQSNSGTAWNYQGTDLKNLSGNWQGTYTNFSTQSANNISVYSTVNVNSATNWSYQGTDLKNLSGNWQNTYTNFSSQSANNISVYSVVQSNSGTAWNYQGTDLKDLSGNWQNTFTTVQSNSSTWNIDTGVRSLTSIWDSTYSTVNANSATAWNYQGTDLKNLSGNWQSTYAYVSSTSASLVLTSDPRLSDSRTPTGSAGGDLTGNYPNPTIKNSVALYGTPTAPTASAGTNNGQIATTEFVISNAGDRYLTTSNTSNIIDNGNAKTFVVASSGLAYTPTQDVTIVWNSDPLNYHMHCTVVSYSGYNLVVDVNSHSGNGTHTDWTINVGGYTTQSGVLLQANNLSDVANAATALTNLGGVSTSRAINTGVGLTGGGDLTTDRTISVVFGNTSTTVVSGDDPRLSNARTPLAHKTTHAIGGIDPLTPEDIGAVNNTYFKSVSGNWDSVYSNVNANSASWNYQGTDLKDLSSNWDSTYTTVQSNSSSWNYQGTDLKDLSGNWDSVYTTVNSNSSTWDYQGTDLKDLSANWDSTYTTVYSNSASWNYQGTDLKDLSANWESVYTTVNGVSSSWTTLSNVTDYLSTNNVLISSLTLTEFLSVRGGILAGNVNDSTTFYVEPNKVGINTETPNEALTVVGNISASGTIYGNINGGTSGMDLAVRSLTSYWDSTYTTVYSNSASWDYQGTDLKNLSGNWESTYETVNSLSAAWGNVSSGLYLPLSGGGITGNLSVSGTTTLSGTTVTDYLSVRGNFYSGEGTNEATFYVEPNKVGINTETPNEALTVVGNISASGMLYGKLNGLAGFYLPLSGGEITGNLSVSGTTTLSGNTIIGNMFNSVATMYVDGNKVGVNTESPNEALTVVGNISSNSIVYANGGNSDLWNSSYTTVQSNSASWAIDSTTDAGVRALTSFWDSTYTTVNANSAINWSYQGTDLKNLSGNWQNTFTTVQSNSSNWNYQGTDIKALTGNWQNTYTNFSSQSANNLSVYSTVNANSATNWNYQGSDLKALSANWQNTYLNLSSYLPLSGGTMTGSLSVLGTATVNGITQLGNIANTIATIYVDSSKVGINTETPNKELTVVGDISATGKLYGDGSLLTGVQAGGGNYLPLSGGNLTGSLTVAGTISASQTISMSGSRVITGYSQDTTPIYTIRALTQAQYDALSVIDDNTIYFIIQ